MRRRLRERAEAGSVASVSSAQSADAASALPADAIAICERLARRFAGGAHDGGAGIPRKPRPGPDSGLPAALALRLAELDPWQRRAVERDGPALVAAQAGSGKTAVLALKALWLNLARGVPLADIVVLTFTQRAADQIAHALAALGVGGRLRRVGTFHAVARAMLAHELPIEETGYTRSFQLQGPFERAALLDELIDREQLVVRQRRRAAQRLEELGRGSGAPARGGRRDDLARLAVLAREEGRRTGSMSFDELLELACALVRRHGLFPTPAWVLVDELQDCSARELAFVEALTDLGAVPFAVGDPAQSIYGWRGGAAEPLFALAQRTGASIELPVNYRASATIVELARALLPRHRAGTLAAHQPPGPTPRLLRLHDALGEGAHIAARTKDLREREGLAWEVFAVLARTRRQLEPIRDHLAREGIPATMPQRLDPRDLPAPYWVMRALRAALAGDAASARYVLEHPDYGVTPAGTMPVGAPSLSELDRHARESPPGRAGARRAGRVVALERLAQLRALAGELDALGELAPEALARFVGDALGLEAALGPARATYATDVAHAERWLAHACRRACAERAGKTPWSLALAEATSDATLEAFVPDDDEDGVRLLTMHAAKGLEFAVVFVVGVNDGLVPLAGADHGDTLDEERRLLYVAVTRARRHLDLSWQASPVHQRIEAAPSRFLAGIPASVLSTVGPDRSASAPPENVPPPLVNALDAPDTTPQGEPAWSAGMQVVHPRYGPGEIVSADARRLVVRFGGYGERTLLALAPGLERAP